METTNENLLDAKCPSGWGYLARRRVEQMPDGPKEFFEMRHNLDDGAQWIDVHPDVVHDIVTFSQEDLTVRNLLLRLVNLREKLISVSADNDEWRKIYDKERMQHFEDIGVIRDRLVEEAENRGWCNEFDEIIDQVNSKLHIEMDPRQEDFDLTVSFTITSSASACITARNVDDAIEHLRSNIDSYIDWESVVHNAVHFGDVQIDDIENY